MTPIRTKDNFLVFGSPRIEEDEIDEVVGCLRSGWIGTGPLVAKFEEGFAHYKGTENAVALNSCTAALHLSLLAANLGKDAEVITTPLTFCATINAIIHSGATPVLADIDPVTWNIDPEEIEKKITPRTRAILVVHFAGRPCEMDGIMEIAKRHNLKVIEDCAHAIETEYKGRQAGTIGDFGCFSFYVTKNLVTGEGGMVLTSDAENAARIKVLGLHGMSKDAWKRFGDEGFRHYQVVECGFKYNMTDMQAALGIHQLKKVDSYWKKRKEIWDRYMAELLDLPIRLPSPVESDVRHAYHLFNILIDNKKAGITRDALLEQMTYHGIGVGVHYLSIPEHPYYQEQYGWNPEAYPNASQVGSQTISLPISAKLTDRDVSDVIKALRLVMFS